MKTILGPAQQEQNSSPFHCLPGIPHAQIVTFNSLQKQFILKQKYTTFPHAFSR